MKLYYSKNDCLKPASTTDVFFWNMMGSLSSSLVSIVFSVIVARLCIPYHSDIFSIAFALAAQIWTIGNFESGTLQVTDSKDKYSPDNYFSFKIIMIAVSLAVSLGVVIINLVKSQYDLYKAVVVLVFCLYRITDAFSNYYHSVFQKNEHLNIGGYSMFIRTVIVALTFTASLLLTGQLITAISVITVVNVVWIVFYEMRLSACYGKTKFSFDFAQIKGIFLQCLPLFLSMFLMTYIINIPKYAIDNQMSSYAGIQTAYNAIFQPAAVINLMCMFIFRPTLTKLATLYNDGEYKKYINTALKIFLLACAFSVVALAGAAVLGIPVLQLIYGKEYIADNYSVALIFIIIGGAFYAFSQLLYNMITVIRKQHLMLIGNFTVLALTYAVADYAVMKYNIFGAAALYMISMMVLTLTFFIIFAVAFKKTIKSN